MRFLKYAVSAFVLGTVVTSAESTAQAQGFALNRFDPSERGSEWFMADSIDLRGHLRPAVGLVGDWGYKPLVAYNADGSERAAIVEHQLFAHLGASIVAWDRVRAAFNLPLALYQTGDAGNTRLPTPESSIGDLRLSADVRLLGEYGSAFNSAIGVALYLPTGSREQFTGDEHVRFSPRAIIAGDIDLGPDAPVFSYGAKLGFNYRPLTTKLDTNSLGSEVTFAASAGLRFLDKKLLIGPELYGSTITTPGSFFERRTTPVEWLIGGHYTASEFRFGAGIGTGLTRGWGSPVVRAVLSAEWVPGIDDDTDKDGVKNSEDACPTVPGIRTDDPKTNGCPPPPAPSDRDGDGILDKDDACPDVPGVKSDDPSKNGCPPDRDGDGIYDNVDACPDVKGVRSDDPKKNGCPPDRDGDGIEDTVDACPDVPGVQNNDPKKNGCPSDRDDDGIFDNVDACPDAPGPADPDPKKNGCPLARIEGGQVKISQQINFKTGSAEILRDSDPILIAVATILKDHPELTKIRVEGHTDNRGAAAMNKDLSNRRAASVVAWLTKFGIDKKRLTSKGFGLERPIDTNETDEGRANNRRVEFHIEAAPEGKPADAKPAPKPAGPATGPAPAPKPAPKP
jgi:outer membrane protein OmpA-like peptidoglycan-associated protein